MGKNSRTSGEGERDHHRRPGIVTLRARAAGREHHREMLGQCLELCRLGHLLLLLLLQDRKKDDAMPEVVLKIDYRFDFLPCWSAGAVLSLGPGGTQLPVVVSPLSFWCQVTQRPTPLAATLHRAAKLV
uniref:Uncharacterized protein n=1 Tax=Anopheles coluzzii TaxID=1518534 RepID=A0A8W7Q2I3_ANOCL